MLTNQPIMPVVVTADASKARPFYEKTLGLKVQDTDEYGISFGSEGSYLRLSVLQGYEAAAYSVLSWVVKDIRKSVASLSKNGVVFERFEGMEQDDLGIWSAPSGAKVAWFKDPDKNILALTQF